MVLSQKSDILNNIPVVDLHKEKSEVVKILDAALKQFGFFYVKNHGIPEKVIQKQFDVARSVFDLPLNDKLALKFDPQLDVGYVGSGVQALDQSSSSSQLTPDTKEQFMMSMNTLIVDSES